MKYSLTVNTNDPAEIAALMAALNGAPAVVASAEPAQTIVRHDAPANADDDDDTGPVNTTAPELDSAGLPWDERIHAKTKGQKADGTWKRGRGVDDATVAAVEAELRARVAGPIPTPGNAPAQPSAPPVNQTIPVSNVPPFPQNVPEQAAVPAQTPAQVPVQPSIAPTPAQPAQTPEGVNFGQIMTALQKAMQAGKIDLGGTQAAVAEINTAWGRNLATITDLAQPQNADMLQWVKDYFVNRGIWSE